MGRFENRYFLVDWKSNHLGNRVEAYNQKALAKAMGESSYFLQYMLYTVALDQYLRLRLPGYHYEEHFGAVYYVFVRGVEPGKGPEFGVFRDRPARRLVERFSKRLMDVRSS